MDDISLSMSASKSYSCIPEERFLMPNHPHANSHDELSKVILTFPLLFLPSFEALKQFYVFSVYYKRVDIIYS